MGPEWLFTLFAIPPLLYVGVRHSVSKARKRISNAMSDTIGDGFRKGLEPLMNETISKGRATGKGAGGGGITGGGILESALAGGPSSGAVTLGGKQFNSSDFFQELANTSEQLARA